MISAVHSKEAISELCNLAHAIWHEHYTSIIGEAQVSYMLNKFQSEKVVSQQITEGYEYYGIVLEQQLLGYFAIKPHEDHLFLSKYYVASDGRKKGLGSEALGFIENRCAELKLPTIELTVNKYNTASIAFYLKRGFEQIKPVVFDIGEGYIMDDFLLRKTLV